MLVLYILWVRLWSETGCVLYCICIPDVALLFCCSAPHPPRFW